MDWFAAAGGFAGSFFGIMFLIGAFLIWDYFDRRKTAATVVEKSPKPKSLQDDVLERHLEELVVENFAQLFPGWMIYEDGNSDHTKPAGIRYRTPAGEIDILCLDESNNFVVIELKRNRAADKVIGQVDRYLAWVEQNLVQAEQHVRGIIIAKRHGDHLIYSASRNADIELWTYDLRLSLVQKTSIVQGRD